MLAGAFDLAITAMISRRLGLIGIVVMFLHGLVAMFVLVRRRSCDPA